MRKSSLAASIIVSAQMMADAGIIMANPEIFISYAWRDDSVQVTEALDAFFQSKGIAIIRDNRDIGYKGLIKEYMQRLGSGKYVVVVLSDQYFKSKSCMYELMQLAEQQDFYDRIFPVTVGGTSIYETEDLLRYVNYWDEKAETLEGMIRSTKNIANLQGITDDLNLYVEIRQNIARLIDFLRNINTHPLKSSDFDLLFEAIQAKIRQDEGDTVAKDERPGQTRPKTEQVGEQKSSFGLHQKIVEFLTSLPNFHDGNTQRALIYGAGLDSQLQNQIYFTGPPAQFAQLLVTTLSGYGKLEDGRHALEAVLESAKQSVGQDKRNYCDTLIQEVKALPNLEQSQRQKRNSPQSKFSTSELRELIAEAFDLEELKDLCDDIDVDFDSLRGEGKKPKVRELVKYMNRRKRMDELLDALKDQRPETF